jgi:segregation and condensation protein B
MEFAQAKIIIEAALLSAHQPLAVGELRRLFDDELSTELVATLLDEIRNDWQHRGVRLVTLASGWRFQTAPEVGEFLVRLNPDRPPRYSRAVMETLAIIAYRQPVTRGDIEEIRGVSVSSPVVKMLEERGWVEVIGHKDVIGRPELLATTKKFLDDLGLRSLQELPTLEDPKDIADALEQRVIEFEQVASELVSAVDGPNDATETSIGEPI